MLKKMLLPSENVYKLNSYLKEKKNRETLLKLSNDSAFYIELPGKDDTLSHDYRKRGGDVHITVNNYRQAIEAQTVFPMIMMMTNLNQVSQTWKLRIAVLWLELNSNNKEKLLYY